MADHAIHANDIIRLADQRSQVTASLREVLHDFGGKPGRYIRLRLSGWHFPERAPEPFVVVADRVSQFVLISPDGMSADAYFSNDLPKARLVEFGYGKVVAWSFPVAVNPQRTSRIDRSLLSAEMRRLFD